MDFTSAFCLDFDVYPVIKNEVHQLRRHPEDVEEALRIAYLNVLNGLFKDSYSIYFEGEKIDTYLADVCLYDSDYDAIEEYLHYNRYLIKQHFEYINRLPKSKVLGLNIHSISVYGGKLRIMFNYIYSW